MKLTFLGTRGNIQPSSPRHRRHTATLIAYRGSEVLLDCGADWRGRVGEIDPRAVVVTHAHPDHVDGLRDGAPCPVWASEVAWQAMDRFPLEERRTVVPRQPVEIAGITFEAVPVEHSVRAPAVGYRVSAGRVGIFYVPDVAFLPRPGETLAGVEVYVGDGACLAQAILRHAGGGRLIGHAPVATQLDWCREAGVPRAIFTHCGSEIVGGDEGELASRLRTMAAKRGLTAELAHDGLEVVLR